MKKMLSVLLALVMVLTMMAGCQKGSAPFADDSTLARKAAENYLDALMLFDYKEASNFTSDPDKMLENALYEDLEEATNKIMSAVPQEFGAYEGSIKTFADAMFDVMKNEMDYEITNVKKDGDGYLVSVKLTTVDYEGEDILADMMESVNAEELLMQLLEDGIINENMSEQQLMDAMIPAMFEKMADAVKDVPIATTTLEEDIHLIKVKDQWLVDSFTL